MYVCNIYIYTYIYISVLYLSVFVSVGRSDGRSVRRTVGPTVGRSVGLHATSMPFIYLVTVFVCLFICLFISLFIYVFIYLLVIIEGSLEVKLPTIWTKAEVERESLRRKKIQVPEKAGKSRNTTFFGWFVGSEGRKVGSLKRCGACCADERWKIACRCGAKNISKSKMHKTHQVRTTFGSWFTVRSKHMHMSRARITTGRLKFCSKLLR